MTKDEAINLMNKGEKLTHRFFSGNEWWVWHYFSQLANPTKNTMSVEKMKRTENVIF